MQRLELLCLPMKAERSQAEARKRAEERFCAEMVETVRARLFKGVSDKEWWQNKRAVEQAVAEPAAYLHARGVYGTAERYRTIISRVIVGIEEHAKRSEIRRMAYYFLHAIQEHMKHQGDGYYEEAKTPRSASGLFAGAARGIAARRPEDEAAAALTTALAASAAVLRSKGGRRKKRPAQSQQGRLF